MKIGIVAHGLPRRAFCPLAERPYWEADWPLGAPAWSGRLGDLGPEDHLVLTVSAKSLLADLRGLSCRVSALLFEPPVIHGRYYHAIRLVGRRYHRVLTHSSRLLTQLPNARFLPHGGCWLESVPSSPPPKTGEVALIASKKRDVAGHKLRHRVAQWGVAAGAPLDVFGRAYRPLADKALGHAPYRYSVVIENSREPGYFTEKLIDALLCWSLPIYWGAPDVAHFFDPRGMICCATEADVRRAVREANERDYAARWEFLEENRRRALAYVDRRRNAALVLAREDVVATQRAA